MGLIDRLLGKKEPTKIDPLEQAAKLQEQKKYQEFCKAHYKRQHKCTNCFAHQYVHHKNGEPAKTVSCPICKCDTLVPLDEASALIERMRQFR